MRKMGFPKQQKGFGLVEVIVSITILTIVMIALHYLSMSAYYNWENASNKAVAYNLIQQEIEKMHNFRDADSVTAQKNWDDRIVDLSRTQVSGNEKYEKQIAVEDITSPVSPNNVKKKVTVTIYWQERLGERSLSGVTYLTDWKPRY